MQAGGLGAVQHEGGDGGAQGPPVVIETADLHAASGSVFDGGDEAGAHGIAQPVGAQDEPGGHHDEEKHRAKRTQYSAAAPHRNASLR